MCPRVKEVLCLTMVAHALLPGASRRSEISRFIFATGVVYSARETGGVEQAPLVSRHAVRRQAPLADLGGVRDWG